MSAIHYETNALKYDFEIRIEAPVQAVWDSLTTGTNDWWLPDFHMVGPESIVSLEAVAGGQLIERKKDGGSLLWYTVVMAEPQKSLHLVGHVAPAWGGPAVTMLALQLVDEGKSTRLLVEDALLGRVSEATATSLEGGWKQLFGDGLKRHLES